jgi:hypothetical protein
MKVFLDECVDWRLSRDILVSGNASADLPLAVGPAMRMASGLPIVNGSPLVQPLR